MKPEIDQHHPQITLRTALQLALPSRCALPLTPNPRLDMRFGPQPELRIASGLFIPVQRIVFRVFGIEPSSAALDQFSIYFYVTGPDSTDGSAVPIRIR